MDEEALSDLSKGLKMMLDSEMPDEHMISLGNLQAMVSTGPCGRVRSLVEAK